MTDLKELIEREVAGFLDWPGDNKNIVTTVSAMLFAEHVARLYADHIPETTKKIGRRQIREAFLRNGARIEPDRDDLPDWVYESVFELLDSAIQQAGPAIQYVAPAIQYAGPAVQGEPVGWQYRFKTTATGSKWSGWYECSKEEYEYAAENPGPCERGITREGRKLYTAPPPAVQQPARRKKPMSYPNGLDMESMPGMVEPGSGHQQTEQHPAPGVAGGKL